MAMASDGAVRPLDRTTNDPPSVLRATSYVATPEPVSEPVQASVPRRVAPEMVAPRSRLRFGAVTVGRDRSIVTVGAATRPTGPRLAPSETVRGSSWRRTVPVPQLVTVTLQLVPEPVGVVSTQPA